MTIQSSGEGRSKCFGPEVGQEVVVDDPVHLASILDCLCDDPLHGSSVSMMPSGVTTMKQEVRTRRPDGYGDKASNTTHSGR